MPKTLLDIKRTTAVTTQAIAERAQLPVADVFTVETGGFCSEEIARQVLTAFNQLSGMQLRLEDIALHKTNHHSLQPILAGSRNRPFLYPAPSQNAGWHERGIRT